MKKQVFLLASFFLVASLKSQTLFVPSTLSGIGSSPNANVGIGTGTTISPMAKLDVRGSVYLPGGNSFWIGAVSDVGSRLRLHNNGSNCYFDYYQNLYFRSGSNTALYMATLTYDGKFGIGTQTPSAQLHVVGNSFFSGNVGIGTSSPEAKLHVKDGQLAISGVIWGRTNRIVLDPTYYSSPRETQSPTIFASGSIEFCDEINKTKCIPISTSCVYMADYYGSPINTQIGPGGLDMNYNGVKLLNIDQNGNGKFNGKVTAKEIEVKANVWSDFVFKKEYKLKSLNEVERFINANKHLPDVPSETEVKEKGINVGDMNAILLQKIEELTLYVIQQQKEIEALKSNK